MSDPFDDRLSDALDAEGRRAEPDPDGWSKVTRSLTRPRRSGTFAVVTAAAVVVLVAGIAALAVRGDDATRVEVGNDPTSSTTDAAPATSTTTAPSTTTTTRPVTTTSAPAVEVVRDPIEMGPLPPTRSSPPETLIAVRSDGTLVHVETATGAVLAEVAHHGDLRDRDEETGMSYGIDGVALSPDGDEVWYSVCCEPAAGSLWRTTLDGSAAPERFADASEPVFASERWATTATLWASVWDVADGGRAARRDWSRGDGVGLHRAVLSPDGQRLVVSLWPVGGESRRLHLVATAAVTPPGAYSPELPELSRIVAEPVELPGSGWHHHVFRRDGRLLASQEVGGRWVGRVIDIDASAVVDEGFDYAGVPLDQDFDPSGEWLLYVVADSQDSLEGTLRWVGPNGESGTVPGTYYAASW